MSWLDISFLSNTIGHFLISESNNYYKRPYTIGLKTKTKFITYHPLISSPASGHKTVERLM